MKNANNTNPYAEIEQTCIFIIFISPDPASMALSRSTSTEAGPNPFGSGESGCGRFLNGDAKMLDARCEDAGEAWQLGPVNATKLAPIP